MSTESSNMMDSVESGDISRFKEDFEQAVSSVLVDKIQDYKVSIIQKIQEQSFEPSNDGGPQVDGGDDDTIFADPSMSKEYFLKRFEHSGHEITLKKLGLGPTKPIVVHVDGKRWEVFPGPKRAEKEARIYAEGMKKESKKADKQVSKKPDEKSSEDT